MAICVNKGLLREGIRSWRLNWKMFCSAPTKVTSSRNDAFAVVVICEKPLTARLEEPIETVLHNAQALFGSPTDGPLSLFTQAGRELGDRETVKNAGITANEKLFLRPSAPKDTFDVIIIYNGIKKPLRVHLEEIIKTVLQKAIALFGSPPNPHLLSLFTETGRELPEKETVKKVGLRPDEKLLLRPSAVKGG